MGISDKIYCAFCRQERHIYNKKHVSWTNVFLSLLVTLFFDLALIGPGSPKSILIFVLVLFIAEFFIQVRWRMALPCPHCHFDPVLYLHSKEKAMLMVKQRLDLVRDQENMLFSAKNPLIYLPRKKVKKDPMSTELAVKDGGHARMGWTKDKSGGILNSSDEQSMLENDGLLLGSEQVKESDTSI